MSILTTLPINYFTCSKTISKAKYLIIFRPLMERVNDAPSHTHITHTSARDTQRRNILRGGRTQPLVTISRITAHPICNTLIILSQKTYKTKIVPDEIRAGGQTAPEQSPGAEHNCCVIPRFAGTECIFIKLIPFLLKDKVHIFCICLVFFF